jgi:tRNA splicing endonuclease
MIAVSIDIAHQNLSWYIAELDTATGLWNLLDSTRASIHEVDKEGSVKGTQNHNITKLADELREFCQQELFDKFLKDKDVFFLVESQVSESVINQVLQLTFKTMAISNKSIKSCLGYKNVSSQSKFRALIEYFDYIVQITHRPNTFMLPSSNGMMKAASIERVRTLVEIAESEDQTLYNKLVSDGKLPRGFKEIFVPAFKKQSKIDDMCDTCLQWLAWLILGCKIDEKSKKIANVGNKARKRIYETMLSDEDKKKTKEQPIINKKIKL